MINQLGTELSLLANREAIRSSGLSSVYIETLEPDPAGGGWRATSGMRATLDADAAVLKLGTGDFGTHPAGDVWTFRVWNDLRPLSDFPLGSAVELRDGIRLEFEPQGVYVPGDYWTFPVRAGDIGNPLTLLDHAAPFGIHHHRVPLAELHWDDGEAMGDAIEDCRVPLHPITAQDGCCTHSVGDGITSHGDFTKINDAIAALPQDGGRVCVLPGEYPEKRADLRSPQDRDRRLRGALEDRRAARRGDQREQSCDPRPR